MVDQYPFEKSLEQLRTEYKIAIDASDKADFEYKVAREYLVQKLEKSIDAKYERRDKLRILQKRLEILEQRGEI